MFVTFQVTFYSKIEMSVGGICRRNIKIWTEKKFWTTSMSTRIEEFHVFCQNI